MAVNELADKAIKETMEFYTKYRVEYDFKKVCSAERETKPKLDQFKPYMQSYQGDDGVLHQIPRRV